MSRTTCSADGPHQDKVWFLPVFVGAGTAEVSCALPARSALVLNIGGTLCSQDEETPRDALIDCAVQFEASAPSLQTLVVDGKDTDEFAGDNTRVFDANLPATNIFDLPAGPRGFAYDGRNVLIRGLAEGAHTIRVLFRLPANSGFDADVDITYHVTIG